ncbi:MAG TPA: HAD family hydrolase, partial [Limnochordia bacterium]
MAGSARGVLAVLLDLGDTIMIEETELKDADGVTQRAELTPGAKDALRALKARGLSLGLVADTRIGTYQNVLRQHGLYELFDAFAISEALGCEKPDPMIFDHALTELGIEAADRHRVLMVGNNLARDIAGARRAGLFSVWCHWNDRYPVTPAGPDEAPDRTIQGLPELLPLIEEIDRALGAPLDPDAAAAARRWAPEIRFDEFEPFLPVLVGCTVTDSPLPSPSFPRVLRPAAGERAIEYAVYWDWDIGHHYELEHLWVYVGGDGSVTRFEASWHGRFHELWPRPPAAPQLPSAPRAAPAAASAPLVAYSQPGKHAFAPQPEWFEPRERFVRPCTEQAGEGGLLVTPLYRGILHKDPERDALAARYLRARAFLPSFRFTRAYPLQRAPLGSWAELDAA